MYDSRTTPRYGRPVHIGPRQRIKCSTGIFAFMAFRHPGGDCYPANGPFFSDCICPHNRRRKRGAGKTCCRCPRRRSNPAAQGPKLPHPAKACPSECSHGNRKEQKQGIDEWSVCSLLFLCLSPEIRLPALSADHPSSYFPFPQTADGNATGPGKGFPPQTEASPGRAAGNCRYVKAHTARKHPGCDKVCIDSVRSNLKPANRGICRPGRRRTGS